jgi:3'(2'), 5'-bisphosphate nucleotidase
MTDKHEEWLEVAITAAREASALVMDIYAGGFAVEYKAKDDPVTRADRESNALLCDRLARACPGVPIVAEESDPATYAGFRGAEAAWFVDPLDGTREFVARNGEFAVMMGLAERGRAVLSVILLPAWDRAFAGIVGRGAWEIRTDGTRRPIHVSSRKTLRGASVLVSRSRKTEWLAPLLASLGTAPPTARGSSGLKAALVAAGEHDIYVQPGLAGMRWDACASDALVRAAGGICSEEDGAPVEYASGEMVNARGLVATNGAVHAELLQAMKRP